MGTVSEIRKTVIPKDLYDLVFGFATGDIKMMRVTVMAKDGKVDQYKFGEREQPSPNDSATITFPRIGLHVV